MKPGLPDVLCFARAAMGLSLVLFEPLSDTFLLVYTLCCLTDVLDGPIARRTGRVTSYGQALDSICDAVVALTLIYCLVPHLEWEIWMIMWIALIAALRLISLGYGTGKYGRPAFVHTYLNKLAGFLLFLTPFMIRFFGLSSVMAFVCSVTTVSAVEYLLVNLTSDELDPDRKSIFPLKQDQ